MATAPGTATRAAADGDSTFLQSALVASAVTAFVVNARPNVQRLSGSAAVIAAAGAVAFVAQRNLGAAVLLALLPTLAVLSARPIATAILGVGVIPLTADLVPGFQVKVSLSDALLLLAVLTGISLAKRTDGAALRPVLPLVGVYALTMLPALAAHVEVGSLINAAQRLQIVLVPLFLGAVVLRRAGLSAALNLYIVCASAIGVAFGLGLTPDQLEFQKNPLGQFVVGALLLVATGQGGRLALAAAPALAFGLFASESRGAVLGLIAGLFALVAAKPGATRLRTAALLLPVLIVLGLAFVALPDDVQQRTTTFVAEDEQPGAPGGGQYTIQIRATYRADALALIRDNPAAGVGIGQYVSGNDPDGTLTNDPHNVVLLETAEGGLPLGLGFLVLVSGTAVMLWRLRRASPLVPLALAVHTSTVLHALVDIYWVRGTPVLGWLLVGAVLADVAARRARAR